MAVELGSALQCVLCKAAKLQRRLASWRRVRQPERRARIQPLCAPFEVPAAQTKPRAWLQPSDMAAPVALCCVASTLRCSPLAKCRACTRSGPEQQQPGRGPAGSFRRWALPSTMLLPITPCKLCVLFRLSSVPSIFVKTFVHGRVRSAAPSPLRACMATSSTDGKGEAYAVGSSTNIRWHEGAVTREAREAQLDQKARAAPTEAITDSMCSGDHECAGQNRGGISAMRCPLLVSSIPTEHALEHAPLRRLDPSHECSSSCADLR